MMPIDMLEVDVQCGMLAKTPVKHMFYEAVTAEEADVNSPLLCHRWCLDVSPSSLTKCGSFITIPLTSPPTV